MTVYTNVRGHQTIWSGEMDGETTYADTGEICDDSRPCIKCGKHPTKEGYDACLGYLEDVEFACCGHGVQSGYVKCGDGEVFHFNLEVEEETLVEIIEYEYICFRKIEDKPKTSVWCCYNKKSKDGLGIVMWNNGWRQYCYFPEEGTVYSVGCLEDINHFIGYLLDTKMGYKNK